MKIAIHAALLGTEEGAPETYITGLINGLSNIDLKNKYVIFVSKKSVPQMFDLPSNFSFKILKPSSIWVGLPFIFPISLLGRKFDVIHLSYITPHLGPGNQVLTIHDLSPLFHPHLYPLGIRSRLKLFLSGGIRQAKHIFCVSEATKQEIVKRFNIPENQLTITYNGIHPKFKPMDKTNCFNFIQKNTE